MPAESSSGVIPKSCQSSWSLKPDKNGKTLELFGAWNIPWILYNVSFSFFFCFDISHRFCDLPDIMGDTAFCYFTDPQDLYILPLLQNLGCQVVDNRHYQKLSVSRCPNAFEQQMQKKWCHCDSSVRKIWKDQWFKLERGSFRDITYWIKYRWIHISNGKSYPIICYPMQGIAACNVIMIYLWSLSPNLRFTILSPLAWPPLLCDGRVGQLPCPQENQRKAGVYLTSKTPSVWNKRISVSRITLCKNISITLCWKNIRIHWLRPRNTHVVLCIFVAPQLDAALHRLQGGERSKPSWSL